jgi:hypothetical protein
VTKRPKKEKRAEKRERETAAALPWRVHFFRRAPSDDPTQAVPARVFLDSCPDKVSATIVAVIDAVAKAPPPAFSGGGKWEAMHDEMAGWYEVRVDGPQRHHYRLFCLLERDGKQVGLGGPSVVLVTGMRKDYNTTFRSSDYASVRALGEEFRARVPRSVAP